MAINYSIHVGQIQYSYLTSKKYKNKRKLTSEDILRYSDHGKYVYILYGCWSVSQYFVGWIEVNIKLTN